MQSVEKTHKFRTTGLPPKLTDAEAITIEICGEFFKIHRRYRNLQLFSAALFGVFPEFAESHDLCSAIG